MNALVTGGCGFIGSNASLRLSQSGYDVTVLDNLSRVGAEANLQWLQQQCKVTFEKADIRDPGSVTRVIEDGRFDVVLHLAGQVAVTTSVLNPRADMEANLLGTFNILEALRLKSDQSILLYACTNKVYGNLDHLSLKEEASRYSIPDLPAGVSESQPIDFHSPYGCSKGAADQYVQDYARIYGLRTVSLRQSCIYGPRQFGIEDQGWVAWFLIAHVLNRPVTIYGTGKQVRDLLFVDDLVDAYLAAVKHIDQVSGKALNVGGGPSNSLSLLEFVDLVREISGRPVEYSFADWRPGDQPVYISDITRGRSLLQWAPRIPVDKGIAQLYGWVESNRALFSS